MRSRAASLCALVVAFACTTLPIAAQPLPAASPGASAVGSAAARSVAAGSACGILEEDLNDQKKTDEQRIAKQLYDTARLPQPFHGVLSSDVLPAEGLTRGEVVRGHRPPDEHEHQPEHRCADDSKALDEHPARPLPNERSCPRPL